jgi:hypothetical protein
MHAAFGERLLDLLGEHALRTDLRKRHFLQAIAGGLDDLDFDGVALALKLGLDVIGLPEGELGATASYA